MNMESRKSEQYDEQRNVIQQYMINGQFVEAELHLIVSNSSPGLSKTIRFQLKKSVPQTTLSGRDLNRVV